MELIVEALDGFGFGEVGIEDRFKFYILSFKSTRPGKRGVAAGLHFGEGGFVLGQGAELIGDFGDVVFCEHPADLVLGDDFCEGGWWGAGEADGAACGEAAEELGGESDGLQVYLWIGICGWQRLLLLADRGRFCRVQRPRAFWWDA